MLVLINVGKKDKVIDRNISGIKSTKLFKFQKSKKLTKKPIKMFKSENQSYNIRTMEFFVITGSHNSITGFPILGHT